MGEELLQHLGPLGPLAGTWEGASGEDTAPADDRGVERNRYRERITLEPIGPVRNHEQCLYGLRYAMTAHRLGETDAFHEELGCGCPVQAQDHAPRCHAFQLRAAHRPADQRTASALPPYREEHPHTGAVKGVRDASIPPGRGGLRSAPYPGGHARRVTVKGSSTRDGSGG